MGEFYFIVAIAAVIASLCIDCTATTEVVICHPERSEGSLLCNSCLNYYFIVLLVHRFLALLGMTLCVLCTRQRSVILSERQ